jgi:hypothetical protein
MLSSRWTAFKKRLEIAAARPETVFQALVRQFGARVGTTGRTAFEVFR